MFIFIYNYVYDDYYNWYIIIISIIIIIIIGSCSSSIIFFHFRCHATNCNQLSSFLLQKDKQRVGDCDLGGTAVPWQRGRDRGVQQEAWAEGGEMDVR